MPPEPAVSILILCHNQAAFTQRCLEALRANTPGDDWEVIALDNASRDETPSLLARWARALPNLTVQHSSRNLGFVRGNNRAAHSARGRLLFLLNNDAQVQPGWLEALLALMAEDSRAGVVGTKLIYPDGRLQEAGGMVFRDGTGWNFGRLDDPAAPEYNYRREVDYVSGAALLVRAGFFRDQGGLDERYAPAYWEDVDLCFRARAAGWRVVYQPLAQVIHHEGATAGTNVNLGYKRYQVVNERRFKRQWARTLAHQPPRPADLRVIWHLADRASRYGRQALVLCPALNELAPDRLAQWMAWRQAGMHVTVAVRALPDAVAARHLADLGIMVASLEGAVAAGLSPTQPQAFAALLQRRSYHVAFFDELPAPADWLADLRALSPHTEIHLNSDQYWPPRLAAAQASPRAPEAGLDSAAHNGLTFGLGFTQDDAGGRWMGASGTLHIWKEALAAPRRLAFELSVELEDGIGRLPVKIAVECAGETVVETWFRVNHEIRPVQVPLGPEAGDVCLSLVSQAAGEAVGGPPERFRLTAIRWLEGPPAPINEPPLMIAPPPPRAVPQAQLDIGWLRQHCSGFRERLRAHKRALPTTADFWYRYDTLANLSHLDLLLPESHRDLAALAGGRPVVDIGAADGDLAFYLESVGLRAHIIDHAPTNHNGLRGARLMKAALGASVEIHDLNLDAQFTWPTEPAGLVLFLGILYHLKNPYYALETLARHSRFCVLSTKIAAYLRGGEVFVNDAPVAYLLDTLECNNDPTNFWIFTERGLERLVSRTGWEMLRLVKLGSAHSDPVSPTGDERAFCLLRSRARGLDR